MCVWLESLLGAGWRDSPTTVPPGGTLSTSNVLLWSEPRDSRCAQERATHFLGDLTVHAHTVCWAGKCIPSTRIPTSLRAGDATLQQGPSTGLQEAQLSFPHWQLHCCFLPIGTSWNMSPGHSSGLVWFTLFDSFHAQLEPNVVGNFSVFPQATSPASICSNCLIWRQESTLWPVSFHQFVINTLVNS